MPPCNMEIHYEMHKTCTLNCAHCSTEALENYPTRDNSQDIVKFLESLKTYDIKFVLTGGEPLLAPDLLKTLTTIENTRQNISIGVFTSGCKNRDAEGNNYISLENAKLVKKSGCEYCYISLFSHIKELHDQITQKENSFATSLTSIKNLVSSNIDVRVNFVLTKLNYLEVDNCINYFTQLGVSEVRLLRLVKHGRAIDNWGTIGLDKKMQFAIVKKILDKNHAIRITAGGFPEIISCQSFIEGPCCYAGINKLYIDSSGNIYPCACVKKNINYRIGHIADDLSFLNQINNKPSPICLQDSSNR